MKKICEYLPMVMAVVSVLVAIYVGVWWFFIGGVVRSVSILCGTLPITKLSVLTALLQIILAGTVTWIIVCIGLGLTTRVRRWCKSIILKGE